MAEAAPAAPAPRYPLRARSRARRGRVRGTLLGLGLTTTYLSLIVLIPLGAVVLHAADLGPADFWRAVRAPESWASLRLTIGASLLVALINVVFGTMIAWVLVRDHVPGKRFFDAMIDLPFALPTIVAGLVLLELYGPRSPVGLDLAYTRPAVVIALLFVSLPFVVRSVQPVLQELDVEMEEAAASLGARRLTIFRRIVLPNLRPAIFAGGAMAFARAISEFGSTVLISGNLPFKTQVSAVYIYAQIETDRRAGAAAVSTVLLVVALIVLISLDLAHRLAARRG